MLAIPFHKKQVTDYRVVVILKDLNFLNILSAEQGVLWCLESRSR